MKKGSVIYRGRLIFVNEAENFYLISKFKHEASHACYVFVVWRKL